MPRPSAFSQELADEICERLANGESLRAILRDDHMPASSSVFRWLADDARLEFREQYARAREAQADTIADEILTIADTPLLATITIDKQIAVAVGNNGGSELQDVTETRTSDAVDRSKLMVDARKWFASKLAPKKYGDRIEHDGTVTVRHEDALEQLE
jgi:hypothetical protein